MAISSVKWLSDANEGVLVDGIYTVPADPDNAKWQEVQEWIALGNTIEAADPPPPILTDDERIDQMQDIFVAFLKAYAVREGVTFQQVKDAIKAQL